ncbi:septum formation family protein [Streptomyces sp. NPDC000229]|uniref:septum formation family protein n=1 Tax=Streptomyces sp. NPDC000229 TaxID=3154247 RepID=UPI00332A4735
MLTELPPAPGAHKDEAARLRQARERAEHVRQLRFHAHVVDLHDVVEHEGNPWVVCAYHPDAADLASRVRAGGQVPVEELARIGLALVDALSAGHFLGVSHGRVSPSAVLLVPDGEKPERVLLTGYGFGGGPPTGEAVGFLAPEQVRQPNRAATPAADLFSLGATLYAASEGNAPPTPPERPEHAGELAGMILEMLAREPGERPSADRVRAALERVSGAAGAGVDPPVPPPDRPRWPLLPTKVPRRFVAVAVAVVLAVAAATLALTWGSGGQGKTGRPASAAPSASPSATAVFPYGQSVGLTTPLVTGDCVRAIWAGRPLESVPNLGVVDCGDENNAQVVAMMDFPDEGAARADASRQCARQADEVVGRLPDAGPYAVVPTAEGFVAAGRRAACLVVSRHIPFNGEVGRFRDHGIDLNLQQMAVGDCFMYKEKDVQTLLVSSCSESHTDQVVGFVEAPPGMTDDKAADNAGDLCDNRFGAAWPLGDDTSMAGFVAGDLSWKNGFRQVICTVGPADGKATTVEYESSADNS